MNFLVSVLYTICISAAENVYFLPKAVSAKTKESLLKKSFNDTNTESCLAFKRMVAGLLPLLHKMSSIMELNTGIAFFM